MNKRDTLLALIALGATPCALAQTALQLPRVALVDPGGQTAEMVEGRHPYWGALLEEMRRLGYVDGRTVTIERWSGGGDTTSAYTALAYKIAGGQPHVIVARGREMLIPIAAATQVIPIVAIATIPAELRVSMAHPGKNVTGIQSSADESQIYTKVLEFLRQLTKPDARIAWLGTQDLWESSIGDATRNRARQTTVNLQPVFVERPVNDATIRRAFANVSAGKFDGVLVAPGPELFPHRKTIAELVAAKRLPSIHSTRVFAEAGLTMSYGANYPDLYRRAAHYVDKILKGAKPADLPIEQPTTFELVINLKAARQIGLTIPQSLLVRADRVIE